VKHPTVEEAKAFVLALWPNDHNQNVSVRQVSRGYTIEIARMYGYVNLSLDKLLKLAEFFGTMNIDTSDRWASRGCDTCDYGSSYTVSLLVEDDNESR
jgi:hypothetical protein